MKIANYTLTNDVTGLKKTMRVPIVTMTKAQIEAKTYPSYGRFTNSETVSLFGDSLETVRQYMLQSQSDGSNPYLLTQGSGKWIIKDKTGKDILSIDTDSEPPIDPYCGTGGTLWSDKAGCYWSGKTMPRLQIEKIPGPGASQSLSVASGSGNFIRDGSYSINAQIIYVPIKTSDDLLMSVGFKNVNGGDFSSGVVEYRESFTRNIDDVFKNADYKVTNFGDETTIPDVDLGGFFDIMNRYAPVVKTNGTGIYAMNQMDVVNLFKSLYNTTVIEAIKETMGIFGDSSSAIKSLRWYYGMKNDFNKNSSRRIVQVGNKPLDSSTGQEVKGWALLSEYGRHQSEIFTIPARFGSYLDHSPYSRYFLHVPFHGYVELEGQDVVGKKLQLTYHIDAHTGTGLVFINEVTGSGTFIKTINTIPVALAVDIPLTASASPSPLDFLGSVLNTTAGAVAMGSGAYAFGASMLMNQHNTTETSKRKAEESMNTANTVTNVAQNIEAKTSKISSGSPSTNVSGSSSGVSYMDDLNIFMVIIRPKVANNDSKQVMGAPVDKIYKIGSLSGFVKTGNITTMAANKYKGKIENMLKEGVYI